MYGPSDYQQAPPVGLSLNYPSSAQGWASMAAPFVMGAASMWGQERANRQNIALAHDTMRFQERMSSTAYQRAVKDMRMAGINPMLAASQGGASSPGGATPTVDDIVGPAVSSAQHARRLSSELKLMAEQGRNVAADTDLKDQNRRESEARERLTDAERKIRDAALPRAEREAQIYGDRRTGKVAGYLDAIFGGRGIISPR